MTSLPPSILPPSRPACQRKGAILEGGQGHRMISRGVTSAPFPHSLPSAQTVGVHCLSVSFHDTVSTHLHDNVTTRLSSYAKREPGTNRNGLNSRFLPPKSAWAGRMGERGAYSNSASFALALRNTSVVHTCVELSALHWCKYVFTANDMNRQWR